MNIQTNGLLLMVGLNLININVLLDQINPPPILRGDFMYKFKGKFQYVCQVNRGGGWPRTVREYEAGYETCQHCDCEGCIMQRKGQELPKCEDKSCLGCQNLKNNVKIRDWFQMISNMDNPLPL